MFLMFPEEVEKTGSIPLSRGMAVTVVSVCFLSAVAFYFFGMHSVVFLTGIISAYFVSSLRRGLFAGTEAVLAAEKGILKEDIHVIFENSSDYVMLLEADGLLVWRNRQTRQIWQEPSVQSDEMLLVRKMTKADSLIFFRTLDDVFREKTSQCCHIRLNMEKETGKETSYSPDYQWVDIHMSFLPEREQNLKGMVLCFIYPVLNRKSTDIQAFENQQDQKTDPILKQDVLLTNALHEMQLPLRAISGYAQLLATDIMSFSSKQREEYACHIQNAVQCLQDMVIEMGSTYSNPSFSNLFDMKLLVEGCCHMVHQQASRKGIIFVRDTSLKHAAVFLDEGECRRIILKLLDKAVSWASCGDKIGLSLKKQSACGRDVHYVLAFHVISSRRNRRNDLCKMHSELEAASDDNDFLIVQQKLNRLGGELLQDADDSGYRSFRIILPALHSSPEVFESERQNKMVEVVTDMKDRRHISNNRSLNHCA